MQCFGARLGTYAMPKFSYVLLISILRLGQAAQKQQRPRCPNPKMYFEIRRVDERLFTYTINQTFSN